MAINKLRFYCQKILPLVYDDSLSYYEVLCKVVSKINELIDRPWGINIADPMEWDITEQYPQYTIVVDNEGTAYISKEAVPAGVAITNEDYWLPVFPYGINLRSIKENIAPIASETGNITEAMSNGDIVWYGDTLYQLTTDLPSGSLLIPDSNCVEISLQDWILGLINDEAEARENGDSALSDEIDSINDRIDTLLKEYEAISVKEYGAVGDGVTDDTNAIKQAMTENKAVFFPSGVYKVTDTIANSTCEYVVGYNAEIDFYNVRYGFILSAKNIFVYGLILDCKNSSCCPINVNAGLASIVSNCELRNTNNANFESAYACMGIYAEGKGINIVNNYIHDINRTLTSAGVIGSNGINAKILTTALIANNRVVTVECSNEDTDCDAIHTQEYNNPQQNGKAIICNNFVKNVTGRFIKIQNKICEVYNNECVNDYDGSSLFFKCVDVQYNEVANIHDNIFNPSGYDNNSMILNIDSTKICTFSNNIIPSNAEFKYFVHITPALEKAVINFKSNRIDALVDYILHIINTLTNVRINFEDNVVANSSRIVASTVNDLTGNYFVIKNNLFLSGSISFDGNATHSYDSVILRDNYGVSDEVTCLYDFKRGKPCDVAYRNATPSTGIIATTDAYVKSIPPNKFIKIEGTTISVV